MADKSTKKKLNKISGQLKKASNMHAAQSKRLLHSLILLTVAA